MGGARPPIPPGDDAGGRDPPIPPATMRGGRDPPRARTSPLAMMLLAVVPYLPMSRTSTATHATDSDDPVLAAFDNAPTDVRVETEDERAAVEAAKAAGRMIPHDDVIAALQRWRSAG